MKEVLEQDQIRQNLYEEGENQEDDQGKEEEERKVGEPLIDETYRSFMHEPLSKPQQGAIESIMPRLVEEKSRHQRLTG